MTSSGTLFSVGATPHQIPLSQRQNHFGLSSTCLRHGLVTFIKFPYKLTVPGLPLCSSSSSNSTTTIVEDELSPVTSESEAQEDSSSPMLPLRGCQACGREEIERGCNGEGRIQGGIAAVPGFGWWPIKAYRPCPGFLASGGRYRRQGQSMDEVAFGRGERGAPLNDSDSSKKKQGPRKFKR